MIFARIISARFKLRGIGFRLLQIRAARFCVAGTRIGPFFQKRHSHILGSPNHPYHCQDAIITLHARRDRSRSSRSGRQSAFHPWCPQVLEHSPGSHVLRRL